MRTLLLAGTSLLAITVAAGSTEATTIDYTGSLQTYTVPQTGTYSIEAFGAGAAPRRTRSFRTPKAARAPTLRVTSP